MTGFPVYLRCYFARIEAGKRKAQHNKHVEDVPLGEGQLVYFHFYNQRGRQKIKDHWSSLVYQVVQAPRENHTLYTIDPRDDLGKVRRVHRSLLKVCLGQDVPLEDSSSDVFPGMIGQEELVEDEEDSCQLKPRGRL